MIDWREHIERNPQIMVGKPVIKGTRITVELILEDLSAGCDVPEILRRYPRLREADVLASLAYAAEVTHQQAMTNATA